MRLWINLPPIGGLIYILRRLVAQTHPNLSYLSKEDLTKPYEELIKKKDYDELRVFRHDSKKDIKADDNLWNNFNKHLRKLDVYSFESARKSFNTTARILGIEEGIKKTLIAQTDHSIQRHYDNYNDPELVTKVQLAHLRIMHHFKIIELYELWLRKIEELFGAQNSDLYVGGSSDFVYRDQLKTFPINNRTNQRTFKKHSNNLRKLNLNHSKGIYLQTQEAIANMIDKIIQDK